MAGEKQDDDTGTAAGEESGAGYGNNALVDDVAVANEDEETMPNKADE
jgi:hypothetical protein